MDKKSDITTQSTLLKPITNNGFVNFMRRFGQRKYGLDVVTASVEGSKAWNRLSQHQRNKFNLDDVRKAKSEFVDACCPKPRRSRCPKPRCRPKPRCPKPRCSSKPRCSKPRYSRPRCSPKPRSCAKPRCSKPRCPPRRRKPMKCDQDDGVNLGPVTNDGYLNFLRDFTRRNNKLNPNELVAEAAREWYSLPEDKKEVFRREADQVSEQ